MLYKLFLSSVYLALAKALICWECVNEHSNESCLMRGHSKICSRNQESCQNEIRRGRFGRLITKSCKQTEACKSNLQALRLVLRSSKLICNTKIRRRNIVCRCCCSTNNCNRNSVGCDGFFDRKTPIRLTTSSTTTVIITTATSFLTTTAITPPPSTPITSTALLTAPAPLPTALPFTTTTSLTIATSSTTATKLSTVLPVITAASVTSTSIASTTAIGFTDLSRIGTIRPSLPKLTTVSRDPPDQSAVPSCVHPGNPRYGNVTCYPEVLQNGRFVIETECTFACNDGLHLYGSSFTTCVAVANVAEFNQSPPHCRRCPLLGPLSNGNYNCTESLDTLCTAVCDQGFGISLNGINSTMCLSNGNWTIPLPCCMRNCPPDIFADIIILLDMSESVNERRWQLMRSFVHDFLNLFDIGRETTQFAIVRYNDVIDQKFQILLEDFLNDKAGLLKAFLEIPYEAQSHADTGLALEYALNTVLRSSNGDRRARNFLVVVTDSEAFNDETVYINALSLRAEQLITFVVGIAPDLPDRLNFEQLLHLAGNKENLFLVQEGFDGLKIDLLTSIASRLCSSRTCESEKRRFDSERNFPP